VSSTALSIWYRRPRIYKEIVYIEGQSTEDVPPDGIQELERHSGLEQLDILIESPATEESNKEVQVLFRSSIHLLRVNRSIVECLVRGTCTLRQAWHRKMRQYLWRIGACLCLVGTISYSALSDSAPSCGKIESQ